MVKGKIDLCNSRKESSISSSNVLISETGSGGHPGNKLSQSRIKMINNQNNNLDKRNKQIKENPTKMFKKNSENFKS